MGGHRSYREGAGDLWHVRVEGPPLGRHEGQRLRVRRAGVCVRRVQVVHHRRLRPRARQRLRPHLRTTFLALRSCAAGDSQNYAWCSCWNCKDASRLSPGRSRLKSSDVLICRRDVRIWAAAAKLAKGACRITSGRSSSGGRARKQVTLSALGACASRYLRPTAAVKLPLDPGVAKGVAGA